jgi:hypothetical protein
MRDFVNHYLDHRPPIHKAILSVFNKEDRMLSFLRTQTAEDQDILKKIDGATNRQKVEFLLFLHYRNGLNEIDKKDIDEDSPGDAIAEGDNLESRIDIFRRVTEKDVGERKHTINLLYRDFQQALQSKGMLK